MNPEDEIPELEETVDADEESLAEIQDLVFRGDGKTLDDKEFGLAPSEWQGLTAPDPDDEPEPEESQDDQIRAEIEKGDDFPPPVLLPEDQILWGKPTAAYTSGATITLNPCDVAGVDNGVANATVQAGWTLPTTFNGNALTGTALTIPVTAIIPYALAADGLYYVLGQPFQDYGIVTYSTTTHKLYQTTWYEWGWFRTTISNAQDITTAVDCTA